MYVFKRYVLLTGIIGYDDNILHACQIIFFLIKKQFTSRLAREVLASRVPSLMERYIILAWILTQIFGVTTMLHEILYLFLCNALLMILLYVVLQIHVINYHYHCITCRQMLLLFYLNLLHCLLCFEVHVPFR